MMKKEGNISHGGMLPFCVTNRRMDKTPHTQNFRLRTKILHS